MKNKQEAIITILLPTIITILLIILVAIKIDLDSRTTSTIINEQPLEVIEIRYINDDYYSFDGTNSTYIPDDDWQIYFSDGTVFDYEPDRKPTIDNWVRQKVKYQLHNRENTEIIDREWFRTKIKQK